MTEPRPYPEWRSDPDGRWRDAFHTFGHLLMTHARDEAIAKIPPNASDEAREVATKTVVNALYNVMMILEGIVRASAVANHYLEFALMARVRESETPCQILEEFELAPEGEESACMGFHFWTDGDFRV